MKKWLGLIAKIVISGGLIWLLFRDVDFDAALQRVLDAEPRSLGVAFALLMLQVVVVAWRWQMILNGIEAVLSFGQTFRFFYISAFFNQALPASVGGDAVRVYKAHKAGLGLGVAFNSAMLDRVTALVALVTMMVLSSPYLFDLVVEPAARWGIMVMVALAFGGLCVLMVLDKVPSALHQWRVVRGLAALAGDARRVFLSLRTTPRVLAVAILGHIVISLSVWNMAMALNINVTAFECILLFPPVLLISSLPVSIAGWGVREGAMVAAFGFAGVDEGAALVLSILLGLAFIVVNLPGGLLWLTEGGRMPPETAEEKTPS